MGVPPETADLDLAAVTTGEQLVERLKSLYIRAGKPSYRMIETRTRHTATPLSKSKVGQILNGDRFPRREVLEAFVQICGVPPEDVLPWVRAWERAAEQAEFAQRGVVTTSNQPVTDAERPPSRSRIDVPPTSVFTEADARKAAAPGKGVIPFYAGKDVIPFYFVCDQSAAMGVERVDALNRALSELYEEISGNPMVADKIRFCLIGFSGEAQVLLPLCDLGDIDSLPVLIANGGTEYGAAFDLLRDTIDQDLANLKADGHRPRRPVVFFLIGSQADDADEWPTAYARIADRSWSARPNIVAFGFDEADYSTIQQIGTAGVFVFSGTSTPTLVFREFAESLTASVQSPVASADADSAILSGLDRITGFVAIPIDDAGQAWLDGRDIQERDLARGDRLGTGGQGGVYELGGRASGYVYKEYLVPDVNGDALARLVLLPGVLSTREREQLLAQSAWPLARVLDGRRVKGFIMRKAPSRFWGRTTTRLRLRELQYLMYEPKPRWGDIRTPGAEGRLEIVRRIAALFSLLHSKHLVVGDVSMRNLLWAPSPVMIYMLDCDSIREEGMLPVSPQSQTPNWDDPHMSTRGFDLETDRYKLALIIARILTQSAELRPGQPLNFVPGLPEQIGTQVSMTFAEAAGALGTRPDAEQWMRTLGVVADKPAIDVAIDVV